jgi:hypothetical protein
MAGCVGYIPKPIDTVEFPRQIAAYLQAAAGRPARQAGA